MFGIFCLAHGVFVFFFIKETKGRTLDVLFGTVDAEKRATDVERMLEEKSAVQHQEDTARTIMEMK